MTREELIERYAKGERDFRGANLSGPNLSGANLSGANLVGANLRGAYLVGADLSYAYLVGADLSCANLGGASFRRAKLPDGYRWASTPTYAILARPDGLVEVGCQEHTIDHWLGHVEEIGKRAGASEMDIDIVRAFCLRLQKERG